MIRQIAHACFRVRDLDAAVQFYTESLGLVAAFDFTSDSGERFGAYLHAGNGTFIELFRGEVGDEKAPSYQHLCLEVDEIVAAVAALRAQGVEVSEPFLAVDRTWQAWLADPDGNRIELHAYTPDSWQRAAMAGPAPDGSATRKA